MLVPLRRCTLINVHFDVFFNVCGVFGLFLFPAKLVGQFPLDNSAGSDISAQTRAATKVETKRLLYPQVHFFLLCTRNMTGPPITFMPNKTSTY